MSSISVELTKLRRLLLTMSAEVEQRVTECFDGLLRHDLRLAERVRDNDDAVDQLDVDIESECASILALHQPVASDLRYVMAALRINADLERIADLARGIAKRVIKLEYSAPIAAPASLLEMASSVRSMLADSLRSLADINVELAYDVRNRDKAVDQKYKEVVRWAALEVSEGRINPNSFIDVISMLRSMERIADLAANVAESVVFAARGTVLRHIKIDQPTA